MIFTSFFWFLIAAALSNSFAFQSWRSTSSSPLSLPFRHNCDQRFYRPHFLVKPHEFGSDAEDAKNLLPNKSELNRRTFITTTISAGVAAAWLLSSAPLHARAADDSFASIAARASQLSKDLDKGVTLSTTSPQKSDNCVYDFTLPVEGKQIPIADLIQQKESDAFTKVKAIVVVNIKQDDPIARKTIPQLITLATRYGRESEGALAVIVSPTDQGYYEPDTSQLIRLKLASEYGYGINPATVVTDKVNLLGTGAHPFWRWLESTCRTPAGLGRIEGNFEKFLIDGRTGQPVRRYPRKYAPLNMADDIEALISGKPIPPARANYLEEWRQGAADAERDTYRFAKGLNYFDQNIEEVQRSNVMLQEASKAPLT